MLIKTIFFLLVAVFMGVSWKNGYEAGVIMALAYWQLWILSNTK